MAENTEVKVDFAKLVGILIVLFVAAGCGLKGDPRSPEPENINNEADLPVGSDVGPTTDRKI